MEDKEIFEKFEDFKSLLRSTKRENIENLIQWLDESDFKFAPASTQYHSNFRGGLLYHSLQVYYHMFDFSNLIQFYDIPQESIIITALLHDICKVNCYKTEMRNTKDAEGNWIKVPYYIWDEQEPLGHAAKSIMLIYENGVQLTKVERAMIRNHMGFSNEEDDRMVSHLFSKCPQSLILYFADCLSTFNTESKDLPQRFKQKLLGRNINECLQKLNEPQEIEVDGIKYTLAKADEEVDNVKVIYITYNNQQIKVYSPHEDGLPF